MLPLSPYSDTLGAAFNIKGTFFLSIAQLRALRKRSKRLRLQ